MIPSNIFRFLNFQYPIPPNKIVKIKSLIASSILPAFWRVFFYLYQNYPSQKRRGSSGGYLLKRFLHHSSRIMFFIFSGIDEIFEVAERLLLTFCI